MGNLFNRTLSAPKDPGSMCSEDGCFKQCVTYDGHRIRSPHKARCCSVCSKWYCGEHKSKSLIYTDIYPQTLCSAEDVHRWVYKCHKDDCLNMYGIHRS